MTQSPASAAHAPVPLPPCEHRPAPYDGPSREQIRALRREYLNPGLVTYYDEPLCVVEGHMQYVWDERGQRYLDAAGGIVSISVGHCHPKVTARMRQQLERLMHTTTLYLHPTVALYARNIAAHMPPGSNLTQTYFGNSGSEANEYAVLMARLYTGRHTLLAVRNGYHGGTGCAMRLNAIGDWKFAADGELDVRYCCPGYCYRCPLGLTYPSCDLQCATSIEQLIGCETAGEVAGLIAEPIQGVGGVVVPPKEYFQVAYEIVRRHGGTCIADEVQSGWGRTGAHFWGFQNFGVVPDMVTMAKGIGNGAPLSAVTTRPEIAASLTRKLHFNTFGGNPVSAAAGLATLEIIDEDRVQEHAADVLARLRQMADRHPLVGDVRGLGLLQGIELVKDRTSKEPATTETKRLVERAKQLGLLVAKSGAFWNTLRLAPPMCITRPDVDFLADCLDCCLSELNRHA
jgi:alanine-glyoxylate transaminase/(R)-3-amino-2-methylpropionate-pyruvate transaminase